jgi:hypothetical protein
VGIEVHFPEVFAEYERTELPPAGTIATDGHWAGRCPGDGQPAVAIADIDNRPESIDIAITRARPWRRQVRAGVYDAHLVTDSRSDDRGAF